MSTSEIRSQLQQAIAAADLPNYIYGYPPKRAYRRFEPPLDVGPAWEDRQGDLNIYIHIPFCRYRCTFCTLFLTTAQTDDLVEAYLESLLRQIDQYARLVGHLRVVSIYVGGGTPTVLAPAQFERLFAALATGFPEVAAGTEVSVEGTPDSMTPEMLRHLSTLGVNRISMGIQSFDPEEMERAGRRYGLEVAERAIESVKAEGFTNFNLDLIYGLEGQGAESWLRTLSKAITYLPTTLSLYPVVFRPLAGISKLKEKRPERFAADPARYELYDLSVDRLAQAGYRQDSFIRFTRLADSGYKQEASDFLGIPLLGLGAGARSYCGSVHYTTDYAVGKGSTLEIISEFVARHQHPRFEVDYGVVLDRDEDERRFVILNLLLNQLSSGDFERRFGNRFPGRFGGEIEALAAEGCVEAAAESIRLTPKGFKYSNIVGNLFYSDEVRRGELAYQPK